MGQIVRHSCSAWAIAREDGRKRPYGRAHDLAHPLKCGHCALPTLQFVMRLAAVIAGVFAANSTLAASAEKGKTAYVQHGCWQCHGFEGQGTAVGSKLAPDPLALDAFTAFIRNSNRAMPPYSESILSNADLADIHAYLQSIPKPADYKTIPLLNE
jgi:mono/diheme cytochrome c family protein